MSDKVYAGISPEHIFKANYFFVVLYQVMCFITHHDEHATQITHGLNHLK